MTDQFIATATTDVVPAFAHRTVVRSALTWAPDCDSLASAHESLIEWARANGYDAVVGVRFETSRATSPGSSQVLLALMNDQRTVRGDISAGGHDTVRYLAYGTAVAYAAD